MRAHFSYERHFSSFFYIHGYVHTKIKSCRNDVRTKNERVNVDEIDTRIHRSDKHVEVRSQKHNFENFLCFNFEKKVFSEIRHHL